MNHEIFTDPDLHFEHAFLAELVNIWQQRKGARAMPSRQDLDPLTMPPALLPHIFMIDVIAGPPIRYRWRLLGTHVTASLGRDSTGKYFDEMYATEHFDMLAIPMRWVSEHKRPLRNVGRSSFADKEWIAYESVYVPLSDDGENVNIFYCAGVFGIRQRERSHFPILGHYGTV